MSDVGRYETHTQNPVTNSGSSKRLSRVQKGLSAIFAYMVAFQVHTARECMWADILVALCTEQTTSAGHNRQMAGRTNIRQRLSCIRSGDSSELESLRQAVVARELLCDESNRGYLWEVPHPSNSIRLLNERYC